MKHASLLSKHPLVYLITEGQTTPQNFAEKSIEILNLIEFAVENKVPLIQIREKNLTARLVFKLTAEAAQITKNSETKILVNDRADIAFAANADGVHLTSNSIRPQIIRQNFPPDFIIGVSAHSLNKLREAKRENADFATFSPIFHSPGKDIPKGLNELERACESLNGFPVIALGGIDKSNYKAVLKAGAAGFAAIRFLNNAENLRNLRKEL